MRNYKVPGKKLQPKDHYAAFEQSHFKANTRERKRRAAAECAAYGRDPRSEHQHVKRVKRAENAVNTRTRKMVERLLEAVSFEGDAPTHLTKRQRRLFDAHTTAISIDKCIHVDEMMWRNAF